MKFTVLCGSSRSQSQSGKVARYLEKELKQHNHETYLLDLKGNPLELWDEGAFQPSEKWQKQWLPISKELESSDGFVFVVPEWNGMVPSAVRNLLQFTGAKELGHKPALIVTVSATRGGALPVSELRASGYKNNRVCFIPEQLIIRDVGKMMNGETPESEDDSYIRKRSSYALKVLEQYTKALIEVRKSGVIDHKTYANGMS